MMKFLLYFSLLIATFSCSDQIVFDRGASSDALVVDGFITDDFGPHHILLSRAASYASILDGGNEIPVEGALIIVEDDQNLSVVLNENEPGNYTTPASFRGEGGRSYMLKIVLADNQEYFSTPQKLIPSGSLDSVYYELIEKEVLRNGSVTTKPVVKYQLDFSFNTSEQYYKWNREETYLFPTLCKIKTELACDTFPGHLVDRNVPIWCYPTDTIPDNFVNLAATSDFSINEVTGHDLDLIDFDFKYSYRHSINVLQYSIGKEAYDYWRLVDQQLHSNGSIFDPGPVRLISNVISSQDKDETVLGFFGVYGVVNKRLYTDIEDFAFQPDEAQCPEDIVIFHEEFRGNFCDDCRWWTNAASGVKPEYWQD